MSHGYPTQYELFSSQIKKSHNLKKKQLKLSPSIIINNGLLPLKNAMVM